MSVDVVPVVMYIRSAGRLAPVGLYLHWGPSLESIYRVSLTVDLYEGNKIISLKNLFHHSQLGAPQKEKTRGPWARAHWLRRPWPAPLRVRSTDRLGTAWGRIRNVAVARGRVRWLACRRRLDRTGLDWTTVTL